MDYFVQAQGGQFVVNCKRFLVSGWNQCAPLPAPLAPPAASAAAPCQHVQASPACPELLLLQVHRRWEMVEAAAGGLELFGASLPPNTTGPALWRQMLDRAVANQFTVVRGWAHTVTPQYALQVWRWRCSGAGWSRGGAALRATAESAAL